MTRLFLAAGVAALAITAPAASAPGDNRGKDRDAEVQKKRGEARAQRAERPQRAERVEQRAERRQAVERRAELVENARERPTQRVDRVRDRRVDRQRLAVERLNARERQLERIATRNDRPLARLSVDRERQIERIADRDDRRLARLAETRVVRVNEWDDLVRGGVWLNGCPPGLAKKPVACVPPGQVKNLVGQSLSVLNDRVALQTLPNRLRFIYPDTDDSYYRFGNGYVYRVNRSNDLISALLPLFGLGLTVGQPFPTAYSNSYLPMGLQPFYASGACDPFSTARGGDYYRFASGYVYEIDCRTGLIEDVDPLLGFGHGFGQMMPLTYSAYNVPYQYRPLYFDTSDAYYRYAPGAIYQVDPTTSLITAVAALLTGGMTVGQPLPLGYSAYNVPLAYRTTYFDTPNSLYRYSNGYIYRVDPRTQLVTALVAAALT